MKFQISKISKKLFSLGYFFAPLFPVTIVISFLVGMIFFSIKPKLQNSIYLILLMLCLYSYYIVGRLYIQPNPMDINAAYKTFFVILLTISPLLFTSRIISLLAIKSLSLGIIFTVFILVVNTAINQPSLFLTRTTLSPFTGEELYSPGLANSLALAVLLIVFVFKNKYHLYFIFLLLSISLVLANRTATVFGLTYILILLGINMRHYNNVIVLKISAFVFIFAGIAIVGILTSESLNSIFDLFLSRLSEEGIQTGRWKNQIDGLEHIFSGQFIGGGLVVTKDTTLWFHNIFIDAYRVGGLVSLILFMLLFIFPLIKIIQQKNKVLFICWFFGIIIACTAVPLESSAFDWYAVFFTISLAYFYHQSKTNIFREI